MNKSTITNLQKENNLCPTVRRMEGYNISKLSNKINKYK